MVVQAIAGRESSGCCGTQLEPVEKIVKRNTGFTERDVTNLAAHGGAIASVKDAMECYTEWSFKAPDPKAMVVMSDPATFDEDN
ncbi:hypothetical protein ABMA32_10060 [Mesorhizobium sp. VNQ89]|uniref:hypothetical protein n=1 Tax=Mesorhizobium quangtriensis TaxID=3157709 RepID=UPI0032B71DE3